ncbi:MAG: asparaginase [SAR202 cluster bacterium]|nr:asparaginase [SAR202 cluster bacterium]
MIKDDTRPLVWLLGTGGTIAQWADSRLAFVEYGTDKHIDVHGNLERIPEIQEFVRTEAEHLWNVGSGINTTELLPLSRRVSEILLNPEVSGVVVTHGTYSLEETAYWLHLTVRNTKPVVVTGTQRPPSAMGTDADNNLFDALILAGSEEARDKGVLVAFNNEIQAAREVTKTNSHRLETFQSRELGMLGYIDSDLKVKFYRQSTRRHTHQSEFDIGELMDLPRVDILYAYQDNDDVAVKAFVAAGAKGLVLSGAQAGGGLGGTPTGGYQRTGGKGIEEARQAGVMVVATNRNGAGQMIRSVQQRKHGIISGDNLSAQKARILLRLALTMTTDPEEIQRMFDQY